METYQAALNYVWGLVNFETTPPARREPYRLERMRALLARLGTPQDAVPAIHIAGSKGKGSTAAMVEIVLRAAGHRTGLFTSPHLHTPRERIRVAGHMISRETFVALVNRLRPVAESLHGVTTFEFLTAMAFVHFAEANVDVAVIEVGLGGRLDATNLISRPLVTIITPLSLEHTAVLGTTLAKIAAEKAGIIKPGVPLVSAPQAPDALNVLVQVAERRGAPATLVGDTWMWERTALSLEGQQFNVTFQPCGSAGEGIAIWGHACGAYQFGVNLTDLTLPLLGPHQLVNATTAVAALHTIREQGVLWSEHALRRGLAHVVWPARVEVMNRHPFIVVDGAHNDASALALRHTLLELVQHGLVSWERLWLVVGLLQDKAPDVVLAPLLPLAAGVVVTQARHPRARPADDLAARLQRPDLPLAPVVEVEPAVDEAVHLALERAGPDGAVVVTGSLFVAAEARRALATTTAKMSTTTPRPTGP
ncbi:MAG: folylpolyglutamate synthase/dihydrofolate synthase family protein [Ardenticatenia bacterium]|nr:folylpolyglutamate synthase/dihydrofolate synthase family protein [Ardenticatenia bacterium]